MNKIFDLIARFFHCIGRFFERLKTKPPKPVEPFDRKKRLQSLLSRDDLAESEQKELAEMLHQFEGQVVFLDSPVPTAKEDL